MSLKVFLKNLISDDTIDWFHRQVAGKGTLAVPDQHYFVVKVESMRLKSKRKGFKTFHGAVHSFFKYVHEEEGNVEMQSLTAPKNFRGLDQRNLPNVLQLKQTVLGPIPYRGGRVQMEMGLFAVESDDIGKSFLGFVSEVADVGGISFVKAAEPVLGLLKSGVDLLLGTDKAASLGIGVAREWEVPREGTFALIKTDKDEAELGEISLDEEDGRIRSNGKAFDAADYLVYSISVAEERTDWASIPDLLQAYNDLKNMLREEEIVEKEIDDALAHFRRQCFLSPDLLRRDSDKLYQKAKEAVDVVLGTGSSDGRVATAGRKVRVPEFADLNLY